jgi:hypothetical protein
MTRLLAVLSVVMLLASAALADQPQWAFEGQMPIIYQMGSPLPGSVYSPDGSVLTPEQIKATLHIDAGAPLVVIRDGEVVGTGAIAEFVAKRDPRAQGGRLLFMRPSGLPEGVTTPAEPRGPESMEDASYDLYVLTDKPVEVLAPDPSFQDIPWGVHDYCVKVGRLRFAIVRDYWPRTGGFRGWQVNKLTDTGPVKVHVDYTWQPK